VTLDEALAQVDATRPAAYALMQELDRIGVQPQHRSPYFDKSPAVKAYRAAVDEAERLYKKENHLP
jgi:hypothetical protein